MTRKIIHWQIAGFAFTAFIGMLLHMLFTWTRQSILVAPFCAVNESIWEHMKLLFFPMFVFALLESRGLAKITSNYWFTKFAGICMGTALVPILFYTFQGITGISPEWFNIVIYFGAIAAAYVFETRRLQCACLHACKRTWSFSCNLSWLAILLLCLIAAAFVIFTFVPPKLPLFQDVSTGLYGIEGL